METTLILKHDTAIGATPDAIIERMLDGAYLAELVRTIDAVGAIDELSRTEEGGRIERVLRYTAPTAGKIPRFLKKYESKAPANVFWKERGVWDLAARTYTYDIVAEVPDHWQQYYGASGAVTIEEVPGGCAVHASLTYDVNVFGLKRVIERALAPEVSRILELQGEATATAFR